MLAGFWEDSAMNDIDEECERLDEHPHDCMRKAESARDAGNQELKSELERLCREAIKKDFKEGRGVLADVGEARKNIRYALRNFTNRETIMTTILYRATTASRRRTEKDIHDFYSDLINSHIHLPPHHLREDGHVIPKVLPSEVRHASMSVKNRTSPGPDRIMPEHLECLPKTALLYKKGGPQDIAKYRPVCLLSVIYKLFTRVILNRIERALDEGQPCEQTGFRREFSTIGPIRTVSKLIEVSREYKMPLCLTFIDLNKAFDTIETEAVMEALDNQGIPTPYTKILLEWYSNFTTKISPFYNVIIDVKRGTRRDDRDDAPEYSEILSETRCEEWNGITCE
ncbi:hypothetical protein RB195_014630 [Necator americanus]|uniref:Reverse transcriptase domain-containing protein n=1 Tax=Necator americanus TaxID=51031 RepID=A0ABR1E1F9_NECAM